jgi:hypothetical protein
LSRYRRAISRLNAHNQKPSTVLAPEEIALAVFSVESLGLVFAHDDRNDGPAFERQQGVEVLAEIGVNRIFVEGASPSTHTGSRFPLHPSLRLWMGHPSRGKVNSY